MSQGSIVQQGTHEELLAQEGLYRELHAMQFADEEKSDTSTEAQSLSTEKGSKRGTTRNMAEPESGTGL